MYSCSGRQIHCTIASLDTIPDTISRKRVDVEHADWISQYKYNLVSISRTLCWRYPSYSCISWTVNSLQSQYMWSVVFASVIQYNQSLVCFINKLHVRMSTKQGNYIRTRGSEAKQAWRWRETDHEIRRRRRTREINRLITSQQR